MKCLFSCTMQCIICGKFLYTLPGWTNLTAWSSTKILDIFNKQLDAMSSVQSWKLNRIFHATTNCYIIDQVHLIILQLSSISATSSHVSYNFVYLLNLLVLPFSISPSWKRRSCSLNHMTPSMLLRITCSKFQYRLRRFQSVCTSCVSLLNLLWILEINAELAQVTWLVPFVVSLLCVSPYLAVDHIQNTKSPTSIKSNFKL